MNACHPAPGPPPPAVNAATRGFHFDARRAAQAVAVVLNAGGPSDYHGILKVLYLANRDAMEGGGKPILGGEMKALQYGPLHSEVFDLLSRRTRTEFWDRTFEKFANYHVRVRDGADPGRAALSPFEVGLLEQWAVWAKGKGFEEITNFTHELPEWRRAYREDNSSSPITAEDLLTAVGFSEEDAAEVVREQQSHDEFLRAVRL